MKEGRKENGKEINRCPLLYPLYLIQAIRAEGKEMELALGLTKMSTADMYVFDFSSFSAGVFLAWFIGVLSSLLSLLELFCVVACGNGGGNVSSHIVIVVSVHVPNPPSCRRGVNKGIAIELIHFVNDGLWRYVFGF